MADASRSRALASLLDQIMSSASNGLIVLAVARVSTVHDFGIASLYFAIIAAAVGFVRGAAGTPLMLMSNRGRAEIREESNFALSATLFLSAPTVGAILLSGLLMGEVEIAVAFAIAVPFNLVQDLVRYCAIARSQPQAALFADFIRAVSAAGLLLVGWLWQDALTETAVVVAWAAFAGASAVGLMLAMGMIPELMGFGLWWRRTYRSRLRFGLEAALEQINVIIIVTIATLIIGTSAAAVLRGASTLLSPFAILMSALPLVVIPEAVRAGTSAKKVWRTLCRLGLTASTIVLLLGCSAYFLPERIGSLLLGESWGSTRHVLPLISVEYFAIGWMFVSQSFLRFQGRSEDLLCTRIIYCCLSATLCATAAFITGSAIGVAAGLAITAITTAMGLAAFSRPRGAHAAKPRRTLKRRIPTQETPR